MAVASGLQPGGPPRAHAHDRHSDFQLWASTSATTKLGEGAETRIDGLVQVTDDLSRVGRTLVRTIVLAEVNNRIKLGGGYLWTQIDPVPGIRFVEHRAVQEFDFHAPIGRRGLAFTARTQMEQRWRQREVGTSFRWRQLTRLDVPLSHGLRLVFWDEYFHELRHTAWSGKPGPSLMINFAGLHLPLSRAIAVEPGYLNQTQFDHGANRVRHAIALYTTVRF
ncbi:DUF2490 domain-containing protein [Sphingomonas trueperi]|uniref:DUF2490 domain-containing protein n=1 Tax=Sphingomonas trueperi TaxID=53317 RepID=UPI0016034D77